jgi:phosphoserine aminotransferase
VINKKKAEKLYSEIKRNSLFTSPVAEEDRSFMNIPFVFSKRGLDDQAFISFCEQRRLMTLKGHRSVGGFRASIYNSMPEAGVDRLINTMQDYEKEET